MLAEESPGNPGMPICESYPGYGYGELKG